MFQQIPIRLGGGLLDRQFGFRNINGNEAIALIVQNLPAFQILLTGQELTGNAIGRVLAIGKIKLECRLRIIQMADADAGRKLSRAHLAKYYNGDH